MMRGGSKKLFCSWHIQRILRRRNYSSRHRPVKDVHVQGIPVKSENKQSPDSQSVHVKVEPADYAVADCSAKKQEEAKQQNNPSLSEDSIRRRPKQERYDYEGLSSDDKSATAAGRPASAADLSDAVDQIQSETAPLDDVFCQYQPRHLIEDCQPHPADVVESSSLAGVALPDPWYSVRNSFPQNTIKEGKLSSLQIEGVLYAGQRHQTMLPSGERAGFFIADAAGVGKGRQIAGIILDNYVRGRKKHIWLSTSPDLFLDARRDIWDIGAYINVIDGCKNIAKAKAGVLFSTYSGLSQGNARVTEVVEWCGGKEFEGCLIFDECHKAKNFLKSGSQKTNSKTANDVVCLQNLLPRARVVYCSATGVSNIKHMAFMKRLGLWGRGGLFLDIKGMAEAAGRRGLGFAEMLAMEMKSRGMYISRGLSFKNTEFGIVEHQFTDEQVTLYDRAVSLWAETLKALQNAFVELALSGQERAFLVMHFWMVHQQFFRQMCLSMKVPTVVREAREALDSGQCVVIGLQSTGESATNFALEQGRSGFVSICREVFRRFIIHQFPCRSKNGCEDEWCRNARIQLLQLVDADEALKKLPMCPLDILIDELGGEDGVAEMTGRKGRMVRKSDGRVVFEARGTASGDIESINNREKDLFMSGKKRVGIISDAASTGISLHADVNSKGSRYRRVHITVELPWSAEKTVQQLGRSHRSFQASAPIYKLVTTDLGGEMRFASAVSKQLQQLGALSRGDRRAAGAGMEIGALNFDTQYGRKALKQIYQYLSNNQLMGTVLKVMKEENPSLTEEAVLNYLKDALVRMDLAFESHDNGKILITDDGDVKKFLNRLLGIPVFLQNLTFRCFWESLRLKIDEAKRDGKYDDGVVSIQGKISLAADPTPVFGSCSEGGQALTKIVKLKVDRGMTWDEAKELFAKFLPRDKAGFFISSQPVFGRFVCAMAALKSDDRRFYRIYRPNTGFTARPDLREEFLRKYAPISLDDAEQEWKTEYERSVTECSHGPSCLQAPDCSFGKRVYEISVLVGAGIIPKLAAMEKVRGARLEAKELNKYDRLSALRIIRVEVEGFGPLCGVRYPASWIPFVEKELGLTKKGNENEDVEIVAEVGMKSGLCVEGEEPVVPSLKEKAFKKPPSILDFFPVISKAEYLERLAKESVVEVVDLVEDGTEADATLSGLDTTEPELARLTTEDSTPKASADGGVARDSEGRRCLRPRLVPRNYSDKTSVSTDEEEECTEEGNLSTPRVQRKRRASRNGKESSNKKKKGEDDEVRVVDECFRSPLDKPGVRENLEKKRKQTNLVDFFQK